MNTNHYSEADQTIRSELMQYAVYQYGGVFEEVYYETAADATQNYVLCLKDTQGRIFNVYENAENGIRTDDYKDSIVDAKMRSYLEDALIKDGLCGKIGVMAVMNVDSEINVLEVMSIQECVEQYGLYSLIFVYHIDGEKGSIKENAEKILSLYRKLQKIDTETIDFNVVVTSGEATKVEGVRTNMRHRYSGSWYAYEEVQEYISVVNPVIADVNALAALIEE